MNQQIPRKIQNNVTIEKNWPDFNLKEGGFNIMSAVVYHAGNKVGAPDGQNKRISVDFDHLEISTALSKLCWLQSKCQDFSGQVPPSTFPRGVRLLAS